MFEHTRSYLLIYIDTKPLEVKENDEHLAVRSSYPHAFVLNHTCIWLKGVVVISAPSLFINHIYPESISLSLGFDLTMTVLGFTESCGSLFPSVCPVWIYDDTFNFADNCGSAPAADDGSSYGYGSAYGYGYGNTISATEAA